MHGRKIIVGSVVIFVLGLIIFFKEKELLNGYFSTVKLQLLTKCISENSLDIMNEKSMNEGIYYGYLEGLENSDTYYLNKEELKAALIEARGDLFGVGLKVQWSLDEQYLIVSEVIPHSPADKAGIKLGDCITKLNGIQVVSINEAELIKMLYTAGEIPVTYEVRRESETIEVILTPEEIILEDFTIEIIDEVLYIDLKTIKEGISDRLGQTLTTYQDKVKGVILDLRDLETDCIEEICKISDLFLNQDIAFKLESKKDGMVSFETQDGAYEMKLVLITNKNTKGGVEALVLALEERAILLGGNTGGDTYINKIIAFEDETGMSVAMGIINNRYGGALLEAGIEPDIRLYITEEEKLALLQKGYITKEEDSYFQEALKQF